MIPNSLGVLISNSVVPNKDYKLYRRLSKVPHTKALEDSANPSSNISSRLAKPHIRVSSAQLRVELGKRAMISSLAVVRTSREVSQPEKFIKSKYKLKLW